ncbi:MAG: hypothetical protein KI790_15640 [Cyclobacteriaceae bacterium]|nr:hypothetical protein [Cyclobacteriaceae bacterium HetDA_MAG_MS6]
MKKSIYAAFVCLLASTMAFSNERDTVVIELDDKSKIIIYTDSKEDLKRIQDYYINQMIEDLNTSVQDNDVTYLELKNEPEKYKNDSTGGSVDLDMGILKINVEDGDHERVNMRLGPLELEVDDFDDLEDEFDNDGEIRKRTYIDKRPRRTQHFFNIDFGTNNWLEGGKSFPNENDEPYSVRPWGSWYIGLSAINSTPVAGPLFLEWGFGINWYNWKLENDEFKIEKGDESVLFVATDPATIDPIKSKLTASFVNVSVVPLLDFSQGRKRVKEYERGSIRFRNYRRRGVRFGVGGYAGYRIASHSKFVFEESGSKGREKDKERSTFYMNNFRYGLRAQFGYQGFDLFFNYDLNNVFATGRGPDLQAISFGVTF